MPQTVPLLGISVPSPHEQLFLCLFSQQRPGFSCGALLQPPHFLPPVLLSTYPVAPTFLLRSWDERVGQAVYLQ